MTVGTTRHSFKRSYLKNPYISSHSEVISMMAENSAKVRPLSIH